MRSFLPALLLCLFATGLLGQKKYFKSKHFFSDTSVLEVTLNTDINLLIKKKTDEFQPATFTCKVPDSGIVSGQIRVRTRGIMRKDYCYMPPLKLDFKESKDLSSLHSLKLVSDCKNDAYYEQLVFKEYIIYKMYHMLTEKSFQVRLIRITYEDKEGKKKPVTQYGFLIEDIDDMAKRNSCKEWEKAKLQTENTDRQQMTLVAIFQYMIGNTDWAVPVNHNIDLIYPKKDSTARPFVIPYDFDYAGLVNAEYAIPDEQLGTQSVLERVYRGFPRNMDELNEVLKIFQAQKENIYNLIKNFTQLTKKNRGEMIDYLDDFYKIIDDQGDVKSVFIDGARTQ